MVPQQELEGKFLFVLSKTLLVLVSNLSVPTESSKVLLFDFVFSGP